METTYNAKLADLVRKYDAGDCVASKIVEALEASEVMSAYTWRTTLTGGAVKPSVASAQICMGQIGPMLSFPCSTEVERREGVR